MAIAAFSAPEEAGATSWTQVPSGTTSSITAIEYQGPTRFWLTTANGDIFTREASGIFTRRYGPSGIPLNDIEFLPAPSQVGMAVGDAGQVLRTTNSGLNWESVGSIPVSKTETTFPDCTASSPLGDVNAVRFASENTAWIMAEGAQLARSTGTPSTVGGTGTWVDANRAGNNTCKIAASYSEGIGDAFFVPANPNVGYFCEGSFHEVFLTTDALSSAATKKPESCGNGQGAAHMAGDPANPSRMWAVTPGPYGTSMTARTSDGWSTADRFELLSGDFSEAADVDYAGGTVLSAGADGMVLNSADGIGFYSNDATGSLATTDWSAVSLAGPNEGAVGGEGGTLAVTSDAAAVAPLTTSGSAGSAGGQIKDMIAPETTIGKKPKKKSGKRRVKFVFASSEPGSRFECKLDGAKKFIPCTSPLTKTVKPGKHKLEVRAIDAAGNLDASPARWSFKVTAPHK
ncbi:MAG TPA: hypothetical protein VJQ84_05910 [Solirubrobacterales bacterium]|nr:hypothetical protein [Solirubrobacterales bacterium]